MDILKYNSFKVQKNTSLNTLKCSRFLDILKSNYGYPKNRIMDILNSAVFLDILIFGYPKMNYGYPKIELMIS